MASGEVKHDRVSSPLNDSLVQTQHSLKGLQAQSQALSVVTSGLTTSGSNGRTSLVQVYVPTQQLMMLDGADKASSNSDKSVRSVGVTNSSRWTDAETRHLLEVWRARYTSLKSKKRNFKEWEIIAHEFNKRCASDGVSGLGPRSGAQCKVRIKNIIADYKRAKGQYHGTVSRQLFPYYDMISDILSKKFTAHDCEEFDDFEGGDEVRPDEIVQLPLTSDVIDTHDVTMATMTVPIHQTPSNAVFPVPVSVHSLAALQTPVSLSPPSSVPQNHSIINPTPLPSLSPIPVVPAAAVGTVHIPSTAHAPEQEYPRLPPKSSHSYSATSAIETLTRRLPDSANETFVAKKKLRKNPRPVKVVKVTRSVSEDDKLLMVVREFMEESRRREEELFDKIFQQQAQGEKRYQEFTLNVIREIGKLFRPGSHSE